MFKEMKSRNQNLKSMVLIAVFVISIFALLFTAGISYKQIQSLSDSENSVLHSYKIFVELERLNLYCATAETNQRGYLLTRDSTFLQTYYNSLDNVHQAYINLKILIYSDEIQSRNLDSLHNLINRRFYYAANVLKKDNDSIQTSDFTKTLIINGTSMMRQAREQSGKMINEEMRLLKNREKAHKENTNFSPVTLLFTVALSLFFFILAFNKINQDLKSTNKINNQLLINNEIFEHSEQIANISNWCWNMEENTLSFSFNHYRLLGCNPDEFDPTIENFMQFVHPDDRHIVVEGNQRALDDLSASVSNFRVIRKDGELRYFNSIGKVITDSFGKTFIIGVNSDITERYHKDKMLEEKLADLERSNQELTAFNHIASHDLQEPLRKIQTFISRIRDNGFENLTANVKDYFSGIERSTLKMHKFIEDLLLYSRANKADKVFEMADLNILFENAKQELSHLIEENDATVISSVILPVHQVIPFQIQQLFINIISNSIKYRSANIPPIVHINSSIVTGAEIPGTMADLSMNFFKISISDNGIGFEQKYSEKLFSLFYRLHKEKEYSGTGIGLSICKIIVENHKGFIFAEGVPNIGSTFTIYLPV